MSEEKKSFFDKVKENLKLFHNSSGGKIVEAGFISGVVFFTLSKIFRSDKK